MRRLPLWMSPAEATSTITVAAGAADCKRQDTIIHKKKESEEEEDSSVVVERDTRKKIAKKLPPSQVEDTDDEFSPRNKRKRTRKQVEASSQKPPKTKTHQQRGKGVDTRAAAQEDDDDDDEGEEELTLDDLMSIAQEYVKADDGKTCEPDKTMEGVPGEEISTTWSTSRNEAEVLPTHTSSTDQEQSGREEIVVHGSSRTGDAARDMLDLFLGPLLKKPQAQVSREEISLEYELQKQSQMEQVGKQVTTLVKKKTGSLRDKVAMLLD